MTEKQKAEFLDLRDFILDVIAERCEKVGMTISSPGIEWRGDDAAGEEIVICVSFD